MPTPSVTSGPIVPLVEADDTVSPAPTASVNPGAPAADQANPTESPAAAVGAVDSGTRPLPPVDPDAEPIKNTKYNYPTYRNVLPDPNDPASPDVIVVIDEEDIPLGYRKTEQPSGGNVYIEDPQIPLGGPTAAAQGSWAFVNLLLAIAAGVLAVALFARRLAAKRRQSYIANARRRSVLTVLGILAGAAAVVVFILTENMALPMTAVDQWTILMAVLVMLQVPGILKTGRKAEEDDESRLAPGV